MENGEAFRESFGLRDLIWIMNGMGLLMDTVQVVMVLVASKALHLYSRMTLIFLLLAEHPIPASIFGTTFIANSLWLNRLVEIPRDFPTGL